MQELPKGTTLWEDFNRKERQAEVHQLKLVCKQFRDVYASHPGLVERLYVSFSFSVSSLPSLLAWVQQNKGSVRCFLSDCGSPLVDAVLDRPLILSIELSKHQR